MRILRETSAGFSRPVPPKVKSGDTAPKTYAPPRVPPRASPGDDEERKRKTSTNKSPRRKPSATREEKATSSSGTAGLEKGPPEKVLNPSKELNNSRGENTEEKDRQTKSIISNPSEETISVLTDLERPVEKVLIPSKESNNSRGGKTEEKDRQTKPIISKPSETNSILQSPADSSRKREDDNALGNIAVDSFVKESAERQQKLVEERERERRRNESPRRTSDSRASRKQVSSRQVPAAVSDDDEESVYHLAHDDIKAPSPEHRKKLDKWYQKQDVDEDSRSMGEEFQDEEHSVAYSTQDEDSYQRKELERRQEKRRRELEGDGGFFSTVVFGARSGDYSYDGQPGGVFQLGSTEFEEQGLANSSMFHEAVYGNEDYVKTKQETAFASIILVSIQLLILCLQLTMCGIASFEVNPFIGPYPDAFSEWGGKNAYLMIEKNQWWRLVTPAFLHVGIIHLLANAFCTLEPIAFFEREWGSTRWIVLYLLSTVGCVSVSCLVDPDTIGVSSSGALMGMFAGKLAQVISHIMFDVRKVNQDEMTHLDQLSSVICGLLVVSLLSFVTYIDWSGHLGSLVNGFFGGMVLFCNPIKSCCWRFLWALIGFAGVAASLAYTFYELLYVAEPANEELANACEYFRYFFPEDYECGCLW